MRKELEKKGKSFLIEILRFFLKNRPISDRVDLSSIKKILVIRQDDRIGNPVLVTPLLIALRNNFPRAKISFLASEVSAELFSGSKLTDELLVLEKKRYIRNPLAFLLNIVRLRKKRFDLAFDCSDENTLSFGHGMWIYLSGAKYRIGYKRERSDLFLNIEVPPADYTRHATEMHLDLLRFLIPEISEELPFLEVRREEAEYIREYLKKMGINSDDFLVGINLGGTGKKKWGFENFIELGNRLKNENVKVIYTWGPQEKNWVKNLNNTEVLKEILPFPKLSALLKRCDLFISSDSGIMHLSTAVGTPTLAIFIHSDPQKYGPRGEKHRMIFSTDGEVKLPEVLEEALKMIGELSSVKQLQMTDNK
ncbi:MAG TPA: glycosyltransferase family 9 protein [candidate division Zixibacteria bacterium]